MTKINYVDYLRSNPRRYLLIVPFAVAFYLVDKIAFFVFGINLTSEHDFFLLWVFSVVFLRIQARVSLVFGLMMLPLSPLFLIFRSDRWADKAAVFAFLFLAVGVLQLAGRHFVKGNHDDNPGGGS